VACVFHILSDCDDVPQITVGTGVPVVVEEVIGVSRDDCELRGESEELADELLEPLADELIETEGEKESDSEAEYDSTADMFGVILAVPVGVRVLVGVRVPVEVGVPVCVGVSLADGSGLLAAFPIYTS